MLDYFSRLSLKSTIKKQRARQVQQFLPWDSISGIALVLNSNIGDKKKEIDLFIKNTNKPVEVFYIELGAKQPSYSDWHCFTRQHKSLLKLPNSKSSGMFKEGRFDLVINLCGEDDYFATALSARLNPTLICSSFTSFGESALVIHKQEPFDLTQYLNEVVHYLKMIKLKRA